MIESPKLTQLSAEAKLLFALILERTELSALNSQRFSENGGLFVYFTIDEICRKIGCGKSKAIKLADDLEKVGLIIKKHGGPCKPNKIFIPSSVFGILENKPMDSEYQTSGSLKNKSPEVRKTDRSNTDKNNTDIINTYSSIRGGKTEEIRDRIEYESLVCDANKKLLDEIVMIISDVLSGTGKTVRIGKDEMPRKTVTERFMMLDSEHITYVLSAIENNKTEIRNIKPYLITMLYNAPATMEAEVAAAFAYHMKVS